MTEQQESSQGGILRGLRGVVMGVANRQSIAWGVAQAAKAQGARLALTHQGGALTKRVLPLAEALGAEVVAECDATDDAALDRAFDQIREAWGGLDFLVHSIAFANRDNLSGRYADTSWDDFALAMRASVYTFTAAARRAAALMTEGGAMLAMTYLGSQRVAPNYNIMGVAKAALESSVRYLAHDFGPQGIRVNAISAGPIRTLAAAGGVSGFRDMMRGYAQAAPLRRCVDIHDVGGTAAYLLGPLSSGVTGDIIHVDAGHHAMAVALPQAAPPQTP